MHLSAIGYFEMGRPGREAHCRIIVLVDVRGEVGGLDRVLLPEPKFHLHGFAGTNQIEIEIGLCVAVRLNFSRRPLLF